MSEWIQWTGGECRVMQDTIVQVKFLFDEINDCSILNNTQAGPANFIRWDWVYYSFGPALSNVVEYRIIENE